MKFYAGIDLGGTFIKCGIVDEQGRIIVKDKIPTGAERDYTLIADDMAKLVNSLCERAQVRVEGVGIGSPGTVDSANGVIVYSNNIVWKNVPLGAAVGDRLGLPVRITNDANAAALGESFVGAGKKFKNVVFVTLGTGVGGGIVLGGKLYEGLRSAGAEIGHSLLKLGGERCTCGRRGCFEAYASATALIKQTKRAMILNPDSKMWDLCRGDAEKADGKTAFDGMRAGDRAAKRVVNDYINYLAEGLVDIANVFRPEAILIGGGICAEGDTLLTPLRKKVGERIFGGSSYAPVQVLQASLGNDAGILGAARLSMSR